jgi:CRP/FNR family transcriptional regulator
VVASKALETLSSIPMYRRLGEVDREHLAALSTVRSYARGDLIFSEGNDADVHFVIASGRVKVFKTTVSGKDIILELFGPGDPLGTVAVYDSRQYPATAVALEPTVCLLTPSRAFFQLLERRPSLVRSLLSSLTLRLVELTNRLAERSEGSVENRFARFFLKMAEDLGHPAENGVHIPLVLTRQDLADFMCTTVETSIRIMSRWSKEGTVLTRPDGFVVVEEERLRDLSEP